MTAAKRLAALIRRDENRTDPSKPAGSGDRHQAANQQAVKARQKREGR